MYDLPKVTKVTHDTFSGDHQLSYYLSKKSFYRLPYSLFPVKATYAQIESFLKDEGILKGLYVSKTRLDALPHFSVSTHFNENELIQGHGSHILGLEDQEYEKAVSRAIGEGLERYMLYKPEHSKTIQKTFKASSLELSVLRSCPTFLKEQTASNKNLFSDNDTETSFSCVTARDLLTNQNIWLPLQYIFWRGKPASEPYLYSPTTNGAGAHFTTESAILSGLFEELQRDTFLMYWLLKKPPTKIALYSIQNSINKKILNDISSRGLTVSVFLLESEYQIPTFVSMIEDTRNDSYFVAFGAGTDAGQYEEAIKASLLEAISVIDTTLSKKEKRYSITSTYKPFMDFAINRGERITLWEGDWAKKELTFLQKGTTIDLPKILENEIIAVTKKDLLDKTIALLKDKVSAVLVYEVDSAVLKQMKYHVVKVFIPELLQLYLLEPLATLSSERLAKKLGKKVSELSISDFNPYPHPFP